MTPFNTIEDLCNFTAFRQGAGGANTFGDALRESVLNGEFSSGQLQQSLVNAREDIYVLCGGKENEEYETSRAYSLKKAELYLATATLYEKLAEKTALKFPEANGAQAGELAISPDTPSPFEKMEVWHRIARRYREIAGAYMKGIAWDMTTFQFADGPLYPFETTFTG